MRVFGVAKWLYPKRLWSVEKRGFCVDFDRKVRVFEVFRRCEISLWEVSFAWRVRVSQNHGSEELMDADATLTVGPWPDEAK